MRWVRRVLTAVVIGAFLTLTATTAMAAPAIPGVPSCDPPPPTFPTAGLAGALDPGPDAPRDGDPFAAGSDLSIYEVYGYGGFEPIDGEPTCLLGKSFTGLDLNVAQMVDGATAAVIGAFIGLQRVLFSDQLLTLLEPVNTVAINAFGNNLFLPLFGVAALITAVWLFARSRDGDVKQVLAGASWSTLVLFGALTVIVSGLSLGPFADKATTGIVGAVNTSLAKVVNADAQSAPDAIAANVHRAVIYQTFLSQTFGRDGGAAAQEFGPRIFTARAFSRADMAKMEKDPEFAKKRIEQKADQYSDAMADLKDKYPIAWEHAAGNRNGDRMGHAFLGLFGALCSAGFGIVAALLLLFARLVARVVLWVALAIALVAQHPRFAHLMRRLADYLGGVLVTGVVMSVLSAVHIAAGVGGILSSNVPTWLAYLLMAGLTLALWKLGSVTRRLAATAAAIPRRHPGTTSEPAPATQTEPEPAPAPYDRPASTADQPTYTVAGGGAAAAAAVNRWRTTARAGAPSITSGAIAGARQGAAAALAAGAVTGGTATIGAAAAGAARGAARGTALTATAHKLTGQQVQEQQQQIPTPRVRRVPRTPTQDRPTSPRIYTPTEPTPPLSVSKTTADAHGKPVHVIWTPSEGASA